LCPILAASRRNIVGELPREEFEEYEQYKAQRISKMSILR